VTAVITRRSLALGGRRYPLVLPSLRDARLHLASVVISIHILGQLGLGFRVSVPQILSAILSAAIVEVVWTFVQRREIVWPASAMLTGSGVALILRVVGTERGDHWTWRGWYIFAGVAVLSLLTKYLIRYRGTHLFNPSNVGLVAIFLLLGSTRVEPLDFWWSPLNGWMIAAYALIGLGGLAITARLRLLEMAAAFWVAFAAGIGLLSATGHCMTAAWAFSPVCDTSFWWTVVTSPEVAIFLFFMITDPRTVPSGRTARTAFSVAIAVLAVVLIAPQSTEFGAKVGLLAALVVLSPLRSLFDRLVPEFDRVQSPHRTLLARLTHGIEGSPRRVFTRGAIGGAAFASISILIAVAGTPARVAADEPASVETLSISVDPSSLPPVTVDAEVEILADDLMASGGVGLATILAESLEVEAEAMRRGDPSLLLGVDQGARLAEMERAIDQAAAEGLRVVDRYRFDSIHVRVVHNEGPQTAPGLAFDTTGTIERSTYTMGATPLQAATIPFSTTFVLRQGSGRFWMIVDAPPGDPEPLPGGTP
jgi:Na+-transporting NADH:ubiquinone oxidoreductase subunit NqrB